jgi:hypothetical protein
MKKTTLLASLVLSTTSSVALAQEKSGTDSASATGSTEEGTIAEKSNAPPEALKTDEGTQTDVKEREGRYYYFIGGFYRGTVVPQFLMNMFVDGGRTVYNSAAGIQLDIRKDGFSIIPQIILAEHAMERTAFLEKGKPPGEAGQWTVVGADIKALYGGVDLLWSAKMAKNFDFEFGFGVGIGVIMGDISNNWVYADPKGPIKTTVNNTPYSFSPCTTLTTDVMAGVTGLNRGCSYTNHDDPQGTKPYKVGATYNAATGKIEGGYTEPGWTHGGSVPSIMPWLSIPILGLRIKPIKSLVLRTQIGFSLTGFYFQLGGFFGLERTSTKK